MNNPDTGDQSLTGTVTSPTAGSNCPAGRTDARCAVHRHRGRRVHPDVHPDRGRELGHGRRHGELHHHHRELRRQPVRGGDVHRPAGRGARRRRRTTATPTPAPGTVTFASPDLTWTGDVPAGGTITITYSVTVDSPDTGDQILASTHHLPVGEQQLPGRQPRPPCTATVTVSQLTIDSAFTPPPSPPAGRCSETTTIANTGQTPYFGISVDFTTANTAGQISDAGNETASSGTLSVGGDRGGVDRGRPGRRHRHDHRRRSSSPAPTRPAARSSPSPTPPPRRAATARPRAPTRACTATATVLIPQLTIAKTARHDRRRARPGRHAITDHHHRHRPDRLHRRRRHRLPRRDVRRRRLRRRRRRHRRVTVLRQPGPDLDRRPGTGRHRDHHLHRHREQPRHRRQARSSSPSPPPPPGRPARPAPPPPPARSPCPSSPPP